MASYRQEIATVFNDLGSSPVGLSGAMVTGRMEEFGRNELQEKKKMPAWRLLAHQFGDFMILVLVAAAVLAGMVGDLMDTWIILLIVTLNAVVGFVQEYRAEKAMDALRRMAVAQAHVIRGGQTMTISSQELVPGDVVALEAGNVVPADLRLFEIHSLRVDESSLTGESVPVDKITAAIPGPHLPPGDQLNMAFKGTLVTHGRGKGVVVATGMQTELGKIANLLQQEEVPTPLQARMEQFGKKLSYIILLICGILLLSGILRGEDPLKILLLAVSLAVAAIPEALPALITVALSRGASRLARQQALVRKLPAVETLGSVTFICSDKTGTLTQNRMRVVEKQPGYSGDEESLRMLHLCMALNHDVHLTESGEPVGESTELALVQDVLGALTRDGYVHLRAQYPRRAELPFDSDRKCMTTVHAFGDRFLVITKGAAEAVGAALLEEAEMLTMKQHAEAWAEDGKRVLAYAFKWLDALPDPFAYPLLERDLALAGVVGLMDPPREEVKAAIAECLSAGIKPVMITGDHPATARAVAREIGILEDKDLVLTGPELQQMSEEAFRGQVERVAVYARVSPDQKLRIVRMLQARGHFAAMTGDGVNDAPSLKAANIGVAMGINGTDVSKEAADLILLDDHFATIVRAVKEGRRIFENIRKFVKYIMTCNGAEIWTIFLAPLLGMPIPLLPIHILWINLVTDGLPALALAGEKAEPDVMRRKPRPPGESLFADGVGYHILWVGLLMAGVTLGTQAWALHRGLAHWQTMVFTVLSLSQLGHVLAVRSDRIFLYRQGLFSNLPLLASVVFTFVLQLAVIYWPPMNAVFQTTPLSWQELLACMGVSVVVFHAVELEKWLRKNWGREWRG